MKGPLPQGRVAQHCGPKSRTCTSSDGAQQLEKAPGAERAERLGVATRISAAALVEDLKVEFDSPLLR